MTRVKESSAQDFSNTKAMLTLEIQNYRTLVFPVDWCFAAIICSKAHASKREVEIADGVLLALYVF